MGIAGAAVGIDVGMSAALGSTGAPFTSVAKIHEPAAN
jgi:hypothetical protein